MKRSLILFLLPFLLFTYVSLILFQKACDYGMSFQAAKEAPFIHKNHVTKYGADCNQCHAYSDNGRFIGLPTVANCVECHNSSQPTASNDPLEPLRKPFLEKYKETDKPWEAYAKQPDLVYFSHKVVMSAKFKDGRQKARCGSCHGDKAGSMTTAKIKGKMLMSKCEDCHSALNISNKCAVCHD